MSNARFTRHFDLFSQGLVEILNKSYNNNLHILKRFYLLRYNYEFKIKN